MKNNHLENFSNHSSSLVFTAEYRPRIKFRATVYLCLISLVGNMTTAFLAYALHLPLFSDTIFTVAITFYAGLVPGLIVAGLYNPLMTLVECAVYGTEIFYFDFLYAFCGILIVFSTSIFSRDKKEFFFNRTVTFLYLLLIAFVSSFLSSFFASTLDTFIRPLFEDTSGFSTIDNFSAVFQKLQFGVFLSYLLPRIPITVLDRLMCTFLGFALYRLVDRKMPC